MPMAIAATAITPNDRNRIVWNVFTHAVPRIPPKNT